MPRMFTFRIRETFDLNTVVNRTSVIGIRTPSKDTISKYIHPKALLNWKYMSFDSCNMRVACAAQLPVDPLGVGFEAGQIAPQDVINPMLFKTVTGESFGNVLNTIYDETVTAGTNDTKNSITERKFSALNGSDGFEAYYALLSDPSWRTVHPQQGLEALDMIPLVREVLSTYPISAHGELNATSETDSRGFGPVGYVGPDGYANIAAAATSVRSYADTDGSFSGDLIKAIPNQFMSGKTRPMPPFRISPVTAVDTNDPISSIAGFWPKAYVGCLILPPSRMTSLYYRMVVEWKITLSGFVPLFTVGIFGTGQDNDLYSQMYDTPVSPATAQATSMLDVGDVVDTANIENVTHVMSSVR